MIKDLPSPSEFQDVAIECLIQAYNNIVNIDNGLNDETPRDEIWEYNQIVLKTGIVLIHQGVESLMKSEICKKSPFLLIEKRRSEWKTLPNNSDDSFSDLYTIAGDDLLKTFYACTGSKKVHKNFINHYEEIRIKRNKIIHGLGTEKLTPEYVLRLILCSFTYLLGKDSFWSAVLDKFYRHPGFDHEDSDVEWEEIIQYNRMEHLNLFLGKKELKKHFSVDITARAYYCPDCSEKAEIITANGMQHPNSMWAFLNPNIPDSTKITCIVCQTEFDVIREDCVKADCKGNIKYLLEEGEEGEPDTWVCLTCWNEEIK